MINNIQKHRKQSTDGFTIVELIVVIVVIGILAAITIVSYNGIQERAHDTHLRSTAAQLQKSIQLWVTQTGSEPLSGYSTSTPVTEDGYCNGGTGGWLAESYTCTMEDMLVKRNLIPRGTVIKSPPNNDYPYGGTNGVRSFMLYRCSAASRVYALYYFVNKPSEEETAGLASAETTKSCPTTPRITYMMKAVKFIEY